MPNISVKVPEPMRAELAESRLVVWEAKKSRFSKEHPWRFFVTLAGPGLDIQPNGFGDSLEAAVADALRNRWFVAQMPGLAGALARLEFEIGQLCFRMSVNSGSIDDDVPF